MRLRKFIFSGSSLERKIGKGVLKYEKDLSIALEVRVFKEKDFFSKSIQCLYGHLGLD